MHQSLVTWGDSTSRLANVRTQRGQPRTAVHTAVALHRRGATGAEQQRLIRKALGVIPIPCPACVACFLPTLVSALRLLPANASHEHGRACTVCVMLLVFLSTAIVGKCQAQHRSLLLCVVASDYFVAHWVHDARDCPGSGMPLKRSQGPTWDITARQGMLFSCSLQEIPTYKCV